MRMQQNMRPAYFRVAGHLVAVDASMWVDITKCLPSFAPFVAEPAAAEEPLLSVELTTAPAPREDPQGKLLTDIALIWDERFRFAETEAGYITNVQGDTANARWTMQSSRDFSRCVVYAPATESHSTVRFSWLIMIAFGQAALRRQTVLIHASVVQKDGVGYVFLGKSGTGKSTHSRLWVEHITGTALLNDDCPAIRVHADGQVSVFGTPWSGKMPCYKQEQARVGAIVRLKQAPANSMAWKRGKEALTTLLPSCPAIRWNASLFDRMITVLPQIMARVSIGVLQCRPDAGAARLCYEESVAALAAPKAIG